MVQLSFEITNHGAIVAVLRSAEDTPQHLHHLLTEPKGDDPNAISGMAAAAGFFG